MKKERLKQLKTDYEELEIKPSGDLWSRIESGIDSTSEIALKPTYQWWKYAAVIVFLITFGGLLFFNSDESSNPGKTVTIKNPSEKINVKPAETVKSNIKTDEIIANSALSEKVVKSNDINFTAKRSFEEIQIPEKIAIKENENKRVEIPINLNEKSEISDTKPMIAERKKTSYISADDLLLGRELDKTREEAQNHKQFGVLDLSKIKIKHPNTLKILGFTVFSDSLQTE